MSFDKSRLKRLALIALALQSTGRIVGRTKVQKLLYLANLCGWNAANFSYHNYGPYSETLAEELDNMRKVGWVDEVHLETSKDRILYSYALSRKARQRALSLVGKMQDFGAEKLVKKTGGLVRFLNKFESDELEIMATLVFLKRENPSRSTDDVMKLAQELKPQFGWDQISKGRRIFRIMRDYLPAEELSRLKD